MTLFEQLRDKLRNIEGAGNDYCSARASEALEILEEASREASSLPGPAAQEGKTINDVTEEDLANLAEAAIEGLAALRFLMWVDARAGDDDRSVMESQNQLAAALGQVGLPQGTYEEFAANVEEMLRSGKTPWEWRAMKDAARGERQ